MNLSRNRIEEVQFFVFLNDFRNLVSLKIDGNPFVKLAVSDFGHQFQELEPDLSQLLRDEVDGASVCVEEFDDFSHDTELSQDIVHRYILEKEERNTRWQSIQEGADDLVK